MIRRANVSCQSNSVEPRRIKLTCHRSLLMASPIAVTCAFASKLAQLWIFSELSDSREWTSATAWSTNSSEVGSTLRYLSPAELEATGWDRELSCEKEDREENVEPLFAATRTNHC